MVDLQPPQIASQPQGAIFTTPVSLSYLEAEDQICPICHEPYIEPCQSPRAQDPDREWPVRVDMVAEWFGLKRCCGHIIGRRCLENHLRARGAWRNKCPVCRDIWLSNSMTAAAPANDEPQASTQHGSEVSSPLQRSSSVPFQATTQQDVIGPRISDWNRVTRRRPRAPLYVQPLPPTGFMQQLLGALEVEYGSDEVKGTLDEVEQRLEALYGDVQE
ncbi:uncharacterized protein K460DRAFT_370261 [Cucurbitaria berberidis CBS 394.84]|uniref:RING-type domain-containing protein n=1 Tax=Cucurbitaria berberidis CBS 394.84 TaxID=1168544 RepID=A0A9P4GAM9_9PLEO|nr:uncharacterized protein K460DRAFT_370261 [Cucurbitaria berberidis CBS 394.84]KAF1842278.1 hypothetical protein K460DRAFT_370261 [Cucurbitaria berberidis CBS 394.84]